MGYTTVAEQPAGQYKLDIYLPELHIAVEYDGPSHWSRRDAARDKYIWETYQLPVWRVSAADLAAAELRAELDRFMDVVWEQLESPLVRKGTARLAGWNG